MINKFVFTCGDINGIGPEIVIKTLNRVAGSSVNRFVLICPKNVFETTCGIIKPRFDFEFSHKYKEPERGKVIIISTSKYKQQAGKVTEESGEAAYRSIEISAELLIEKKADAVITAPISKQAIKMAGHNFPGHTEMYAKWSGAKHYVMMFLSKKMNAALATIHEPIKEVPALLNTQSLTKNIEIIISTLKNDLQIDHPKIAVLGLNPHAGENGLIGTEDKTIIATVVNDKKLNKYLSGPFSPDAFFANMMFRHFNLVLGMYHDQVLIPFKMMNFGAGVNYTAGLSIVRTSPDHGTAFDIAGKGSASEASMMQAFNYAGIIVKNRKK